MTKRTILAVMAALLLAPSMAMAISAPTGLTAGAYVNGTLPLMWNEDTSAVQWNIYFDGKLKAAPSRSQTSLTGSIRSYLVQPLAPAQAYTVTMRALAVGQPMSAESSPMVVAGSTAPFSYIMPAPGAVFLTAGGGGGTSDVNVLSSALPSGAATEAKQDAANTSLSSIDVNLGSLANNGITVAQSVLPANAARDDSVDAIYGQLTTTSNATSAPVRLTTNVRTHGTNASGDSTAGINPTLIGGAGAGTTLRPLLVSPNGTLAAGTAFNEVGGGYAATVIMVVDGNGNTRPLGVIGYGYDAATNQLRNIRVTSGGSMAVSLTATGPGAPMHVSLSTNSVAAPLQVADADVDTAVASGTRQLKPSTNVSFINATGAGDIFINGYTRLDGYTNVTKTTGIATLFDGAVTKCVIDLKVSTGISFARPIAFTTGTVSISVTGTDVPTLCLYWTR